VTTVHYLVVSTVLLMAHVIPVGVAYVRYWGWSGAAGNRVAMPDLPGWAQRASAASRNMSENFLHFAVLAIIAVMLKIDEPVVATSAAVFFYARLAYWFVYIAGIAWVRTLLWITGLSAELVILYCIVVSPQFSI